MTNATARHASDIASAAQAFLTDQPISRRLPVNSYTTLENEFGTQFALNNRTYLDVAGHEDVVQVELFFHDGTHLQSAILDNIPRQVGAELVASMIRYSLETVV